MDTTDRFTNEVTKAVVISAKPGRAAELREALLELQRLTRLEPGCRSFDFYQAIEDESGFVLLECFSSQDAFEVHMVMPYSQAFFAAGLVSERKQFL